MPTTETLKKKHVMFKISEAQPMEGTVFSTEAHGVWIQISSNTKIPGATIPAYLKFPVMFVPFYQLEWLMTAMDQADLV